MKPTIGRIVHLSYLTRRVPAIVWYVDPLTNECHLRALDDTGVVVYHAVNYEEDAESAARVNNMNTPHNTWAWPPTTTSPSARSRRSSGRRNSR